MSFKYENEVLIAALDEFAANSYEKASLNNIIKKSGMSKGSFYHHFKDKYSIYIYILRDGVSKKWEFINSEIVLENTSSSHDIFSILSRQIKLGITFGDKYPKYFSLANNLTMNKESPVYQKVLKDLGIESNNGLNSLVLKSIENKEFNDQYSEDFIIKMMSFFFNSYYDIFTDYSSVDSFILFLKKGLGN